MASVPVLTRGNGTTPITSCVTKGPEASLGNARGLLNDFDGIESDSATEVRGGGSGRFARLNLWTAAQHIGVYPTNVTNPSATRYGLSSSGSVLASTPISNNPAGQTFFVDAQLA